MDLTGAGLELSKAWNKMLEKVKKANSNRKGNEYFIVDLIVACDINCPLCQGHFELV